MADQIYTSGAVAAIALGGLASANFLHDRGLPHWVARRTAAVLGGLAFLAAVAWLQVWIAVAVVGSLTILIAAVRLGFRRGLRGVDSSVPSQRWAEVTFAAAGTLSLICGWALLGDRWLALLPIAFMAWGDNAAGVARDTLWRNNVRSDWPQVLMLAVCLGAAAFYRPYWIGAIGAIAATAAERYRPRIKGWDDNLNVVCATLIVLGTATRVASALTG